ncbi:MAG TPA: sigma-70 family RNA polymerase sigma factor [Candidatus Acidoferrales bacterium]|nr:sigma-70 family RNA polymerase sigma factor [Candidatus Acidoferrales bacterium]
MAQLDHLYRTALHLVKNSGQAEDLVQETCVRALQSRLQFAAGTNLKAWLTKILYNFFCDQYQEAKRWLSSDAAPSAEGDIEELPSSDPGPEHAVLEKELRAKIAEALDRVPEEYRLPLLLVDMGELSYAEAAEVLSCPIGTVRSRLSRGRKLMHKHLKGYLRTPR